MTADSHQSNSERRPFPGWAWVWVAVAIPISGYIGWGVGGHVDAVPAALIGGALTGAGLGAVQWWAAKGALGGPAAWISASAVGYAAGLAVGAALVGYDTDTGALVLMGVVSGASLGAAQGLVLVRQGNSRLGFAWGAEMPILLARLGRLGRGRRHQRRRPIHGVRRRRRAAVHVAQRAASRALHASQHPGGVMRSGLTSGP